MSKELSNVISELPAGSVEMQKPVVRPVFAHEPKSGKATLLHYAVTLKFRIHPSRNATSSPPPKPE